jgi:hypothetical protein
MCTETRTVDFVKVAYQRHWRNWLRIVRNGFKREMRPVGKFWDLKPGTYRAWPVSGDISFHRADAGARIDVEYTYPEGKVHGDPVR